MCALALGAFVLIASEFMPVSLLTPIAAELGITEGQAGQAIAISGAFALITSLLFPRLAGRIDRKRLLLGLTLLMMVSGALALLGAGSSLPATAILLAGWGLVATAAPVGWWMWLSRTLPQDAEAGGGLMVAVIQLAIMLGAMVGGVLFDAGGYRAAFGAGAVLLLAAAVLALRAMRAGQAAHAA